MKIHGFWHVADCGFWRVIAQSQWWRLWGSGLLDATDRLHVQKVGGAEDDLRIGPPGNPYFRAPHVREHPKVAYRHHPDREQFEFPTLGWMREVAISDPEPFAAYYIHVKGAASACQATRNPAFWWAEYMMHYTVYRWRDCVAKLEGGHDLVGCDIRHAPALHFSGNFFWATSAYLKRLPDMTKYHAQNGHDRIMAEMWHGAGQPNYFETKRNGENMYLYAMTPDMWD